MSNYPAWLPELMPLEAYGGNWHDYVEAVYSAFKRDFIVSQPKFKNFWVRCRRDPLEQGKEAGFWHCISGGKDESKRTPELRRMERVSWIRAIIEHTDDTKVSFWHVTRGSDRRCCIWLNEEFIVVLTERKRKKDGFKYWQLITAYDTDQERRKNQLRRERDENIGS